MKNNAAQRASNFQLASQKNGFVSKKIIVIGAGSWGTAIANLVAQNSSKVFLSANRLDIVEEINKKNTNQRFLPNIKLSKNIKAIEDFSEEIKTADLVFIVTPSSSATEIFTKIKQIKLKKNCGFVICSKGFEHNSLMLLSDAFEKTTKIKNYAVFSGPNFAIEVANQEPSVTTIASRNKKLAREVIEILSNDNFQAHYFKDPRTAEICGIVKNVIAIGCGIVEGLGLGVNAKSAVVMKGISEIQALCKKMKASTDISHAAGFGDIFLTCSSTKSRNNSLGVLLARGKSYAQIAKETGQTYEGEFSASAVCEIAKKLKLQLDLCEEINQILTRKHSPNKIRTIISKSILTPSCDGVTDSATG
ncbi:MAG: NAD(P)-dependent glycerol-3-phosphate dehydrogenase [Proteobacteria bacterium]|nr:NAD(P)-dependent glycerol-3-phosphate dehydrogenase [Pseudomonadota bacterium]